MDNTATGNLKVQRLAPKSAAIGNLKYSTWRPLHKNGVTTRKSGKYQANFN